ncbi:ELMO domain-containing protein [Aphelenchoides besseyi]|nr:ELMO domain-containing protein [Aphelenchoides besseyi]KAI6201168.1 ELMO domain-containing protein [Aphelenchoides besseyi]
MHVAGASYASTFNECWEKIKDADLSEATTNSQFEEPKPRKLLCIPHRNPFHSKKSDEKSLVITLSRISYSEEEPIHWELLSSIYGHLNPESEMPARFGDHWLTVGFQGENPATDLRGAGIFGLCQLLYIVSGGLDKEFLSRTMITANDNENGFPFAVVGLNVTHMLLKLLKSGKIDRYLNKKTSLIDLLNRVYARSFLEVMQIWWKAKCTICDFQVILAVIGKQMKKPKRFLRSPIGSIQFPIKNSETRV